MSGRKRGHNFAITINNVEWSKTCFAEYFIASDIVKRLAVGEEKHHPSVDCDTGEVIDDGVVGRHHHIFVEFVEGFFLPEVRDLIVLFLGGEEHSFDIQVRILLDIQNSL